MPMSPASKAKMPGLMEGVIMGGVEPRWPARDAGRVQPLPNRAISGVAPAVALVAKPTPDTDFNYGVATREDFLIEIGNVGLTIFINACPLSWALVQGTSSFAVRSVIMEKDTVDRY